MSLAELHFGHPDVEAAESLAFALATIFGDSGHGQKTHAGDETREDRNSRTKVDIDTLADRHREEAIKKQGSVAYFPRLDGASRPEKLAPDPGSFLCLQGATDLPSPRTQGMPALDGRSVAKPAIAAATVATVATARMIRPGSDPAPSVLSALLRDKKNMKGLHVAHSYVVRATPILTGSAETNHHRREAGEK